MPYSPHEGVSPGFRPVSNLIQNEVVGIPNEEADNPRVGIGEKGEQSENRKPLPAVKNQNCVFVLPLVRSAKKLVNIKADTMSKNKVNDVVEVDENPDEKRGYGERPRFEKSEEHRRYDG